MLEQVFSSVEDELVSLIVVVHHAGALGLVGDHWQILVFLVLNIEFDGNPTTFWHEHRLLSPILLLFLDVPDFLFVGGPFRELLHFLGH